MRTGYKVITALSAVLLATGMASAYDFGYDGSASTSDSHRSAGPMVSPNSTFTHMNYTLVDELPSDVKIGIAESGSSSGPLVTFSNMKLVDHSSSNGKIKYDFQSGKHYFIGVKSASSSSVTATKDVSTYSYSGSGSGSFSDGSYNFFTAQGYPSSTEAEIISADSPKQFASIDLYNGTINGGEDDNSTDNTSDSDSPELSAVLNLTDGSAFESFAENSSDVNFTDTGIKATSDNASVTFSAFDVATHGNISISGDLNNFDAVDGPDSGSTTPDGISTTVEVRENGSVVDSVTGAADFDTSSLPNGSTVIKADLDANRSIDSLKYVGTLESGDSVPIGAGPTGGFFQSLPVIGDVLNAITSGFNSFISWVTGVIGL